MASPYPNLWRRGKEEDFETDYYIPENTFHTKFDVFHFNAFVDTHTKKAALEISASVVSVISYSGEEQIFWGSGFIAECKVVDGIFLSTIFTSASLLRCNTFENSFLDNLKVEVILADGSLYIGCIVGFDWHLNVSTIEIQSAAPFPVVNLRHLDNKSYSVDPFIAVGRYHSDAFELMVAPGRFSSSPCGFDCNYLLRVNCRITKCGIGGPVINLNGEVVGISFYSENFTPFLPINVVSKWWDRAKGGRGCNQPWLGMKVLDLQATKINHLETIVRKFPNVSNGVIVTEVTPDSPAALVGICPHDVIVQAGGEDVDSCLEFGDIIWDKAGETVVMSVLRASNGTCIDLAMVVGIISPSHFNSWPLPAEYSRHISRRI